MSASKVKAGQVFVEIGADPRAFFSALNKINRQIGNLGRSMSVAGTKIAGMGAAALLPFGAAIRQGTAYQSTLLNIQASTGATTAELDRIKASSMAMSRELGIGPTAAAEAIKEMVKGGLTLDQVLGGAGKTAAEFSAVAEMAAGEGAVVLSKAMNAFGVDADTAANALSAAADASATSIPEISQAFSQVSAVAASSNQSIEDLAAGLAVLANKGIVGSDAGTSVKTMLQRLKAPSDEAAEAMATVGLSVADLRDAASGKLLSLPALIGKLEQAFAGVDEITKDMAIKKIFGDDAIRAAEIFRATGKKSFEEVMAAMAGALPVSEKYRTLQSGLAGQMASVDAAMRRAAIAISEAVAPSFMQMSTSLIGAIDAVALFVRDNPALVMSIAKTAAAAIATGGALIGLGSALRIVSFALGGFIGLGKAVIAPIVMMSDAVTFLSRNFLAASTSVVGFASKGIAAVAQFAAEMTGQVAVASAKSGALAANYFAGTISIVSATVARAAEGNMRAAAIGVQALGKIGASGARSAMIAGSSLARLTSTGGTQLARLGVQGSTALATVGASAATAGTTAIASFARSAMALTAYTATSIASAGATAAAWAVANTPFLALVGVAGGAILVVSQLGSLISQIGGSVKESFNTAVAQSVTLFSDLHRIASATFGAISDALAAGDLELAMESAMAGLLAGFTRGANALMSKVEELSASIINTFDAFKSIAAQPLMMFESIKDPIVEADRKALRERQDARLAAVTGNDAARAAQAKATEKRVQDLAAVAAGKRADVDQSRVAGDRLSDARTMQDVDLARQIISQLLDAGNLTAEAEQRLVEDYRSKFAEMMQPTGVVAAGAQEAVGGGLSGYSTASGELFAGIASATDMNKLGRVGKKIDELISGDKLSVQEEDYLLSAYRDQQNRLADMQGVPMQSQAEVAGTFSSTNLGGMGFGSSLIERIADYGKRTAEATEQMAGQAAVVGE